MANAFRNLVLFEAFFFVSDRHDKNSTKNWCASLTQQQLPKT